MFLNYKVNWKERSLLEEPLTTVLHKIPSHFVSLILCIWIAVPLSLPYKIWQILDKTCQPKSEAWAMVLCAPPMHNMVKQLLANSSS